MSTRRQPTSMSPGRVVILTISLKRESSSVGSTGRLR